MSKAEILFREAFERLKANAPINVSQKTKISQNNVAKDSGKHPTALKKERYPSLVLEIQDHLKQQGIDSDIIEKKKLLRKQRTLKERLDDSKNQRDKLSSICEAQAQMIEDLHDELNRIKSGLCEILPINN